MRRIIALAVLLLCLSGPRVKFRGEGVNTRIVGETCLACRPELWYSFRIGHVA